MWADILRVFRTRQTNPRKAARNRFRPALEDLEVRTVPATLVWKGPVFQGDFDDPVNWINGQTGQHAVPGPRDDAFINGAQEVVVTAPTTINSLTFPGGQLDVIAGVTVANFRNGTQIRGLNLLQSQSAFVTDNATQNTLIGTLQTAPGADFDVTAGKATIIQGADVWGNVFLFPGAELELADGSATTVHTTASLADPSGPHEGGGQLTIDARAQVDWAVPLDQIILVDKRVPPQVSYIEWGSDWQYSPRDGHWYRAGLQYNPDGTVDTVDEAKAIVNEANGNTRTTIVRTVKDNNGNVKKKTKVVRVDKPGPPRSIEAKGYEWQNGQWVQTWSASIMEACA